IAQPIWSSIQKFERSGEILRSELRRGRRLRCVIDLRARRARGWRLYRRDRLHLDQKRLFHQPVDHQQRVRWVLAVREHFWKFTQAEGHEFRNVLGMDEIGRELNTFRKGGPRRFQRRLDVAKYLCRLGVEIALADDIAFG